MQGDVQLSFFAAEHEASINIPVQGLLKGREPQTNVAQEIVML